METIIDRLEKRGRDKGIEIGERRGRSEGRLEGRLEGKLERNRVIALNMKRDGLSIDKIMLYTELSEEEIRKL